jgi:hypothetical protein
MPGVHAPPHHVAATIAIVRIVGIVSVVVGPEAKPYKRTPAKSAVKSSTVKSTASEASMEAAAVKAAPVTAAAASVAATTAASGRHGWLNQADSR